MTSTPFPLENFFHQLFQEKEQESSSIILTSDNAATHLCRISRPNKRSYELERESRWGAASESPSYPMVVLKPSRWSAPMSSSPLNRKRTYLVAPPQRRMSFDDVQKGSSLVPLRR